MAYGKMGRKSMGSGRPKARNPKPAPGSAGPVSIPKATPGSRGSGAAGKLTGRANAVTRGRGRKVGLGGGTSPFTPGGVKAGMEAHRGATTPKPMQFLGGSGRAGSGSGSASAATAPGGIKSGGTSRAGSGSPAGRQRPAGGGSGGLFGSGGPGGIKSGFGAPRQATTPAPGGMNVKFSPRSRGG